MNSVAILAGSDGIGFALPRRPAFEGVASAIAWFLHPAQGSVTGQVPAVDGGLSSFTLR